MATLIKNIEEYKAILGGVQKDMNAKTFMPFVKKAEEKFIIPEIGEELYDSLCTADEPTGKTAKLIQHLSTASAHYADMMSVISLVLSTGDIGITQNKTQNSVAITKWQYVEKIKTARDAGDFFLEKAVNFLYKNHTDFPEFEESEIFSDSSGMFFNSAESLTEYLPVIDKSQLFFNRLKPYIKRSQKYFIRPYIWKGQLEQLLTLQDSENEIELEAVALLRNALAQRAFAEAIPFLNISPNFRVMTMPDGITLEDDIDIELKTGIQAKAIQEAEKYVMLLQKHLQKNASANLFEPFFTSELYQTVVKPAVEKLPPCNEGDPFFF